MGTEELIVVTNVGLIVIGLAGFVASILANERIAGVARALVNVFRPSNTSIGKHER